MNKENKFKNDLYFSKKIAQENNKNLRTFLKRVRNFSKYKMNHIDCRECTKNTD